jgi:DNA-directed RNA polymerase specialized sigma subunit
MAKTQSLLEAEFQPAYEAWKKKPDDPEAKSGVLTALHAARPSVFDSALQTYAGSSAGSPTLRSHAKMIALEALPSYDPRKAKLRTHLMVHLQRLHRLAAREEQPIRLPEQVGIHLQRAHGAFNELTDQLGREPSDAELSKHMGISMKRLQHIRQYAHPTTEGSMAASSQSEDSGGFTPAVVRPVKDQIWQRFVYHDLSPVDQFILEHSAGLYGKPVLQKQQIAKKLHLSPGAVSQRLKKIQERLDLRGQVAGNLFQ